MYLCGSITSLAVFVTCYDFSTGSERYHNSKFVSLHEVTTVLSLKYIYFFYFIWSLGTSHKNFLYYSTGKKFSFHVIIFKIYSLKEV